MSIKILIADDESRMRILVSDFLTREGYNIIEASNGEEAIQLFMKNPDINLIILDIMMPRYNGLEVCEEIRKVSQVPIIMLTAKNTEPDELKGFRVGTDEYITKPFSPSVFVARVNALLKRTCNDEKVITKGQLSINMDKHYVLSYGERIDLSQTEFKLLLYMVQNEGLLLTREQLLNKVWGYDYDGTDRTIDTHMNRLRIKLGKCQHYIKTIRGYGYKFEVL